MTERKCLECNDALRGRADQKFCSDQCRNLYNNRQLGEISNEMRRINRILKKNHSVLSAMNPTGKVAVSKSDLLKKEFNFNYFTNIFTNRNGRSYYYCYDQGYAMLEGDKVLLVVKQEFVD